MNWLSIDPSNRTGIAKWENDKLTFTTTARAIGGGGKWCLEWIDGKTIYESKWELFSCLFKNYDAFVIEEGFGQFKTAVKSQAGYREYFHAIVDYYAHNGHQKAWHVVNVNEWRRVIKEEFKLSWPATTERKKALSVATVKKAYGIDVSDDESDAVLLGRASMRLGIINWEGK
jgi:hypothetical protein